MKIPRRRFLSATAAAVLVAGTRAKGTVFGANARIGMACIGLNGRGRDHLHAFLSSRESQVVAVCDVDRRVLSGAARAAALRQAGAPAKYTDIRELLEDDAVDAVSIATPNHWHTLAAIWAVRAGKHVYVEKPLSHEVAEGRRLVEEAKKHNRIVMHGTQRRSGADWINAVRQIREGVIGDIYMARALCYKQRDPIGFAAPKPPPDYLDWSLWQGPAQEQEYCDNYVHYNWHWFWRYGNGDIGNQGVHQMDVATWGLNKGLPVKIASTGGRYTYGDQGETPNTQVATFTYRDGAMLVFEVRGRYTNSEEDTRVGNLFYGSEGYFVERDKARRNRNRFRFCNKKGRPIRVKQEDVDTRGCYGNFLRAVASGDEQDNFAPALAGHIASAHCHLANIAYRLGRTLDFNPDTERFTADDEANAMLTRNYRGGFELPA
ncbi:MAG: Gfo/Idh/MocA family oxidoreductase [Candidatus Hydrogenedentes bacterium]|nr:Gfo/Idh/MocA family oxidoreductase [Candidatus Hydrogenedentota bacterium]